MKQNRLKKYWSVFKVSLEEIFIWRLNFILWRVRSVMQLLLLYFLWSVVFSGQENVFGYTRAAIFTYVLGTAFLRSMVLSSRSIDVAGEIHDARLTTFLLRPVSYIRWWLTRDVADKFVNLGFASLEVGLVFYFLRPPIFLQTNPGFILLTLVAGFLALLLFFFLSFLLSLTAFWILEVWAPRFLGMVVIEFLSGGTFPLDILPLPILTALRLTPFPYLIFFPLKIYLGQLSPLDILAGFSVMFFWLVVAWYAVQLVWQRGLRVYSAEGQ